MQNNRQVWEVQQYATLINKILHSGQKRASRAGDVYSIFGETIAIDCAEGFPVLKGRKMFYEPVLGELAAFFRGPKNVADFQKFGCNYWNEWGAKADDKKYVEGTINIDYGNKWRDWNGVDQLAQLVDKLQNNPLDRRMIISGWDPSSIPELSLPCCHMLYQWYVRDAEYLDMIWYQRSVDTMVGLPSDIILAWAWNVILANQCGYKPGVVKLVLGDTHIYQNHVEGALEYMRQLNKTDFTVRPKYTLVNNPTVDNFRPDMIQVADYEPMPAIKFKLNV